MSDELNMSEALTELVFDTFEHAFHSIEKGGPLIPFALLRSGDERSLRRFLADDLRDAVDGARQALRALDPRPDRATFAFDGYVRSEDERIDAIFVEAFEAGMQAAYRFVVAYSPATEEAQLEVIDDQPSLIDECEPLF